MIVPGTQPINKKTMGGLKRLLKEDEVADRLGYSRKALQAWRAQGRGPKFLKIGRSIRYPEDALVEFMESLTEHRSTSEYVS